MKDYLYINFFFLNEGRPLPKIYSYFLIFIIKIEGEGHFWKN